MALILALIDIIFLAPVFRLFEHSEYHFSQGNMAVSFASAFASCAVVGALFIFNVAMLQMNF